MKIEINIENIPKETKDFFSLFCDSIKKELDKQKKEEEKEEFINPGYGYYLITNNDILKEEDEEKRKLSLHWSNINYNYWSNQNNAIERITKLDFLIRRKIPIPRGYILVPEGDLIKKDYMCINPNINMDWEVLTDTCVKHMLKGYTYCKPIKKIFDKDWYNRGDYFRNILFLGFNSTKKGSEFETWINKNEVRLRALQILEDKIAEKNGIWKPVFNDFQNNYSFWVHNDILLIGCYLYSNYTKSLCFKSAKIGKELIEELGSEFICQALGF